ncbi:hypothetical protein ACNTMW_34220 [Planosporangium sp. 12N6]|uniref:hypothetical protein n=1 Tax=Planosporangium spinosum TaxID=3402278 RepID=UPI003CF54956
MSDQNEAGGHDTGTPDGVAGPTISKVGSSRGWIRLSIDGRTATVPGEVIMIGERVGFVVYVSSARWDDDGGELPAPLLEHVRTFLQSPNTLVE